MYAGAEDVQSKQSVELETLRADVGALVAKLERVSKEKSAAAEKLAVLQVLLPASLVHEALRYVREALHY